MGVGHLTHFSLEPQELSQIWLEAQAGYFTNTLMQNNINI